MKTITSLQLIPMKTQMRIAMNKMCQTLPFYRLAPALLLFSFLVAGCADSPSEIRYDDRMKTYTTAKNETGETYTVGDKGNATAHYILRPGNRPDFQPKVKQAHTQTSPTGVPKTQLADLQMVLEVSDILFEFDKWVIRADGVPELDKWAVYFQENPQVTADIYGHADSTGPSTYNLNLSEKRAQAVINYLVDKGVDPKRFIAKGFGESQPAVPNTTSEGRQKNRRVELNL
jgi:outer membrane protein OmpA-like peptidoglycan-associated protein